MSPLPVNLYSPAQTRELDRLAMERDSLSASTLLTRAGAAALQCIQAQWPDARQLLIVCGSGNNAGDGYELAQQAHQRGMRVCVIELGNVNKMRAETVSARQTMLERDITPSPFSGELPKDSEVVVDALLGTGLDREVSGLYADAIHAINQQNKPVLALDIPSGLDASTGQVRGVAVHADVSLSFIGLNTGLFTGDAADYVGQVSFDALDIAPEVYDAVEPCANRIKLQQPRYQHLLRPRRRNSHKGLFGHSLIIGGDAGMSGAIRIAAEAAARSGSGLVSIATRQSHAALINIGCAELMCHGVETADALTPYLKQASHLAIGPGLGQSDWSLDLFNAAVQCDLPMVIDADALNLLAQSPKHHDNWILTPHPGEAARLLGCTTAEIQADRWQAVKQLQQRYGGVVVLKGAGTLIYDGQSPIRVSGYGNPGMASGGMGDALTGIITGLLGQRLSLSHAAELGVMAHGQAADLAAQAGERGLLASDLLIPLRRILNPS